MIFSAPPGRRGVGEVQILGFGVGRGGGPGPPLAHVWWENKKKRGKINKISQTPGLAKLPTPGLAISPTRRRNEPPFFEAFFWAEDISAVAKIIICYNLFAKNDEKIFEKKNFF